MKARYTYERAHFRMICLAAAFGVWFRSSSGTCHAKGVILGLPAASILGDTLGICLRWMGGLSTLLCLYSARQSSLGKYVAGV